MSTSPIAHPFEGPGTGRELRPANRYLAPRSGGRRLHAGIDLRAAPGTPVLAPEDGVIVQVAESSYAEQRPRYSRPRGYAGYGPAAVLMRGATSGLYHLLAHVDPSSVARLHAGDSVREGQALARVPALSRHVHWELRVQPHPDPGQATVEVTSDPLVWLASGEVRRYLDLHPRVCPRVRWRAGLDPAGLRRLCPRACRLPRREVGSRSASSSSASPWPGAGE